MTTAVLCFVFAVWPVVAFVGALGFAPLTGVAALATSPVWAPRLRIRIYMIALIAFFAYAAASALWSPRPSVLIDLEKLSVRSEILRVGLLLLAGGGLIAAAQTMNERGRMLVARIATIALIVQLVSVVVLTIFAEPIVLGIYGSEEQDEGAQNITRNALIMAVVSPFLVLGLVEGRGRVYAIAIGAAVIAAEAAILIQREVDAGLLFLLIMAILYVILRKFRRSGFRIIGALIALAIMTAPFVFQVVSSGVEASAASNSIQYRQLIWHSVIEIIWQNPIFGSGVGVLRTHLETIPEGVFVGQLHIPNHAHNMLLQLWVETGAVGATLISLAVVLASFRLPSPEHLGNATPRIAALIAGVMATWVSFDLWNEWRWAVSALLCVLTIVNVPPRAADVPG